MAVIIKTNKCLNYQRVILKVKKVLRFYFSADSLERAFGNLILNSAYSSAYSYGGEYAEKICSLIGEKQELSELWSYIDGVMNELSEEEFAALKGYAGLRCGIKNLCVEKRREIKRAAMKFRRRAKRLESFENALGLVGKYYCLLTAG